MSAIKQKLNCALLVSSSSAFTRFLVKVFTACPLDDQLIHPKDLAVDLFKPDIVEPKLIELIEFLLRKEVIQPQVPLRLPCYDFIPVTAHSVGG